MRHLEGAKYDKKRQSYATQSDKRHKVLLLAYWNWSHGLSGIVAVNMDVW
jgi:hypothetical protein